MIKSLNFVILLFAVALFGLVGCGDDNGGENGNGSPDQSAMLQNIGANLIVAGYEDFQQKASGLQAAAQTLSGDLTQQNLDELRSKWRDAYLSWQYVGFYNFGPAQTQGLLTINFYPTDTAQIHSNIQSGDYNLANAGATFAKGFPALDYLLYGYAADDAQLLDTLQSTPGAMQYIVDVSTDISNLATAVYDQWNPNSGDYLDLFVNNTGTSVGSSLSLMVNAWSQYMELYFRNAKIGIPNGNSVVSDERFGPFPEKVEGFYSKMYSLELAKTASEAVTDFYMGIDQSGNNGEGLYDYLSKINAQDGTLAEDYKGLLEAIGTEMNDLNPPLTSAIETQGDEVTQVFNALKSSIAVLKVDVVSALSISITYADNDGD